MEIGEAWRNKGYISVLQRAVVLPAMLLSSVRGDARRRWRERGTGESGRKDCFLQMLFAKLPAIFPVSYCGCRDSTLSAHYVLISELRLLLFFCFPFVCLGFVSYLAAFLIFATLCREVNRPHNLILREVKWCVARPDIGICDVLFVCLFGWLLLF